MAEIVPPPAQHVTLDEDHPYNRVRLRLFQIAMTAGAVVVTGWFFMMGIIPGIIALFITKHFLVAVLALGMRVPPSR